MLEKNAKKDPIAGRKQKQKPESVSLVGNRKKTGPRKNPETVDV
jgi:hypothetical protein